jgi:hypothetical protein
MSMKRTALLALLLAVASVNAAFAYGPFHTPTWYADYTCSYTNPPYPSVNGLSTFVPSSTQYDASGNPIFRDIEYYDASYNGTTVVTENRKITFAKPVNTTVGSTILYTTWEFTINPSGPQCKRAVVSGWGAAIDFSNCTDGHTRHCDRLY